MGTLVIEGVDLDILEIQRQMLNNIPIFKLMEDGRLTTNQYEALAGIESMLDYWSDKLYEKVIKADSDCGDERKVMAIDLRLHTAGCHTRPQDLEKVSDILLYTLDDMLDSMEGLDDAIGCPDRRYFEVENIYAIGGEEGDVDSEAD